MIKKEFGRIYFQTKCLPVLLVEVHITEVVLTEVHTHMALMLFADTVIML